MSRAMCGGWLTVCSAANSHPLLPIWQNRMPFPCRISSISSVIGMLAPSTTALALTLPTFSLVMTSGIGASAQEHDRPTYAGRLGRRIEEQNRKETADQLRFERARARARQRMQQDYMNERMGRSTLRPYTNTPYWALGLGQK